MKTKTITIRQMSSIKKIASVVNPMVQRKATIMKKMEAMQEELASLNEQIAGYEGGIKALCFGLGTEQLVHKLVTPTGKLDAKTGKETTKTTYVPNDCFTFDAENSEYTLTVVEEEGNISQAVEEKDIIDEATSGIAIVESADTAIDVDPFML